MKDRLIIGMAWLFPADWIVPLWIFLEFFSFCLIPFLLGRWFLFTNYLQGIIDMNGKMRQCQTLWIPIGPPQGDPLAGYANSSSTLIWVGSFR